MILYDNCWWWWRFCECLSRQRRWFDSKQEIPLIDGTLTPPYEDGDEDDDEDGDDEDGDDDWQQQIISMGWWWFFGSDDDDKNYGNINHKENIDD